MGTSFFQLPRRQKTAWLLLALVLFLLLVKGVQSLPSLISRAPTSTSQPIPVEAVPNMTNNIPPTSTVTIRVITDSGVNNNFRIRAARASKGSARARVEAPQIWFKCDNDDVIINPTTYPTVPGHPKFYTLDIIDGEGKIVVKMPTASQLNQEITPITFSLYKKGAPDKPKKDKTIKVKKNAGVGGPMSGGNHRSSMPFIDEVIIMPTHVIGGKENFLCIVTVSKEGRAYQTVTVNCDNADERKYVRPVRGFPHRRNNGWPVTLVFGPRQTVRAFEVSAFRAVGKEELGVTLTAKMKNSTDKNGTVILYPNPKPSRTRSRHIRPTYKRAMR